ncbi:MAG: hypothetical protein ING12_10025 [Roseomonas sp.]|nr:hypothetical protein [Roseomonas sp.]
MLRFIGAIDRRGRHCLPWQRNNSRDRRTLTIITIGQIGAGAINAIRQSTRPILKNIMVAPKTPHALSEMRIEMAVENGITRPEIQIPAATMVNFVGDRLQGGDGLAIPIGTLAATAGTPLMRMQVEDMGFFGASVKIMENDAITDITMMRVRRIILIEARPAQHILIE